MRLTRLWKDGRRGNMRVRLKGLKVVNKKLADGSKVQYYYAWIGGPRIEGEPGSPEFVASYNAAVATRPRRGGGKTFNTLTDAYLDSDDYLSLAERTRRDYAGLIKLVNSEFGGLELSALAARGTRAEFMAWRDKLAKKSRRQADYAWTVLARV